MPSCAVSTSEWLVMHSYLRANSNLIWQTTYHASEVCNSPTYRTSILTVHYVSTDHSSSILQQGETCDALCCYHTTTLLSTYTYTSAPNKVCLTVRYTQCMYAFAMIGYKPVLNNEYALISKMCWRTTTCMCGIYCYSLACPSTKQTVVSVLICASTRKQACTSIQYSACYLYSAKKMCCSNHPMK